MTTILLIQLFKEPPLGISTLEIELSQRFGGRLVAMDSYSDGSNLAYVRKMIEESEAIIAIIWEQDGGTLKGMQPIFNALLKKKQGINLITNTNQGTIGKLSKAMESMLIKDEVTLMEIVKKSAKNECA